MQQASDEKVERKIVILVEDDDSSKEENGDDVSLNSEIVPRTGREAYAELREKVLKCRDQTDASKWDFAEALYSVKGKSLKDKTDRVFHRWGYRSWEEYVNTEVLISIQTAQYLHRVHETFLVEFAGRLPARDRESVISAIKEIGWSKIRFMEPLVRKNIITSSNIRSWIKKAKKLNVIALEAEIKIAQGGKGGVEGEENEKMSESVNFKFSKEQAYVVREALELAGKMLDSEVRSHQMSMICQDFLSTNMAQTSNGTSERDGHLNKMGALYGLFLVAIDRETGRIVYGNRDDFKFALSDQQDPKGV